jgi:hypothetical protein
VSLGAQDSSDGGKWSKGVEALTNTGFQVTNAAGPDDTYANFLDFEARTRRRGG